TRVVNRINASLKVALSVRHVFDSPTVAALGATVQGMIREGRGLRTPPIRPVPRDQALALSFAQQRLWFLHQLEPTNPVYNIPVVVRLKGRLDPQALEESITEIINRHETLRTQFSDVDGQPVQHILPKGPVTLPVIDLTSLSVVERETEAARVANEAARLPFNLAQESLFRVQMLRLAESAHLLMFNLHHIIADAWSLEVL